MNKQVFETLDDYMLNEGVFDRIKNMFRRGDDVATPQDSGLTIGSLDNDMRDESVPPIEDLVDGDEEVEYEDLGNGFTISGPASGKAEHFRQKEEQARREAERNRVRTPEDDGLVPYHEQDGYTLYGEPEGLEAYKAYREKSDKAYADLLSGKIGRAHV